MQGRNFCLAGPPDDEDTSAGDITCKDSLETRLFVNFLPSPRRSHASNVWQSRAHRYLMYLTKQIGNLEANFGIGIIVATGACPALLV